MNVSLSIAKRYFFSKGNRSAINIISAIAASGVAIGSMAMIIVLSAFNGLETLVTSLYTSVDPDIRVSPEFGKTMAVDSLPLDEIAKWPEIKAFTPMLEETAFLQFRDQQTIVTLRGIDPKYLSNLGLDTHLIEGDMYLGDATYPGAVMGYGIADNLNLFVRDGVESIKVFAAKRDGVTSMNPQNKFVSERIMPYGIVQLNPEFDYKYFYVPFSFASKLLQYQNRVSFLDISLKPNADEQAVKEKLQSLLGDGFDVKTRMELNEVLYKTNATEKWVTFFILSFILVVATFNLIGSLTMLIIEKKKDISLLRSIGTTVADVKKVFLFEGLLITGVGAGIGLGIGLSLVLLQQYVGFFPLEGVLVEYYPMEFNFLDLLAVISVVLTIGWIASAIPVNVLLTKKKLQRMV